MGNWLAFQPCYPKIPVRVIENMIRLGRNNLPNELGAQIFYDNEQGYFLYVPTQENGPAFCTIFRSAELELNKVLVADIHTHGYLPAFFSGIDDADELGFRIFMVLGRLDTPKPEFCIRVGANGSFLPLSVDEIFDDSIKLNDIITLKEWRNNYGE